MPAPNITANRLLEGPILGSLIALAVPIVVANVLQSAYQSSTPSGSAGLAAPPSLRSPSHFR